MFQRLAYAAMTAATVFALAACNDDANAGKGTETMTGSVAYRERIALPPTAQVKVSLVDVSLADAPSVTIAETVIAAGGAVPIPFSLTYDPARIEQGHTYALQARITDQDKLLFITTTQNRVLDGQDNKTDLMLERVN